MADEIESGEDRPAWLQAKFANGEALAQSYTEAEKELGRLRSELAAKDEQFSAALAAIDDEPDRQPQGQWSPQGDPTMIAMQNALEQGDAATFAAIQLQLNQAAMQERDARLEEMLDKRFNAATNVDKDVTMRLAMQQVAPDFGDEWGELGPKVIERLKGRQDLLPQVPTVEGYATAFADQAKLIRYETLEAQAKAAEADRRAKLDAQTLGGGLARTPTDTDAKKAEWDEVKNADLQSYQRMVSGG